MTGLKDNRTLRILNAAAAGKYGVLAAIAYYDPNCCAKIVLT
jgi:hypothetical protein